MPMLTISVGNFSLRCRIPRQFLSWYRDRVASSREFVIQFRPTKPSGRKSVMLGKSRTRVSCAASSMCSKLVRTRRKIPSLGHCFRLIVFKESTQAELYKGSGAHEEVWNTRGIICANTIGKPFNSFCRHRLYSYTASWMLDSQVGGNICGGCDLGSHILRLY